MTNEEIADIVVKEATMLNTEADVRRLILEALAMRDKEDMNYKTYSNLTL